MRLWHFNVPSLWLNQYLKYLDICATENYIGTLSSCQYVRQLLMDYVQIDASSTGYRNLQNRLMNISFGIQLNT